MKEKLVKNMEVPVALMELLLQTQRSFGIFFLFDDLHFTMLFRGIGFSKLFRWFLGDKIKNWNVVLRMYLRMCFCECVSNLLLVEIAGLWLTRVRGGSVPRLTLWCCISISQYLCKPFASRFVFTSMSDKKMNLGSFRGVCMLGTRM